ncbi:MAG: hypothetical protein ACPGWR_23850 [Ardenticatenaceae bacterium]
MFYLSGPILPPHEQAGMRVLPKRPRIIEQIRAEDGRVPSGRSLAAC